MATVLDRVLKSDELVKLAQKENFVGWVYGIDYEHALVMTNDLWKARVNGIPHNCFLVAATFDPDKYSESQEIDREVILLRVIGAAKLPQDDDLVRTKIDHFQDQQGSFDASVVFDDITLNQIQFGGLKCRVLGTFYTHDNKLWLGSDIESFSLASRLRVYRPSDEALERIINHVDPIREGAMKKDALELGLERPISPIPIGTIRYTSTDRLHRKNVSTKVKVFLHPSDFLARRTAVLGMTRTGKSNMVKQTVTMVKRVADEANIPIGQIIFDINGEYANANQQDKGAISEVYASETIRYRMVPTKGFVPLLNNFYTQLNQGFSIVRSELQKSGRVTSDYIRSFVEMSFDEPEKSDRAEHNRWEKVVAAYQAMLYKAGYAPPPGFKIRFSANENVRNRIDEYATNNTERGCGFSNPSSGLSPSDAAQWFEIAHALNTEDSPLPGSRKGSRFVDDTLQNLLNMIAQKRGAGGAYISGWRILDTARKYHSESRATDVTEEVYEHLRAGKIVILDLSVGNPEIRENVSRSIASKIFDKSMEIFVDGKAPPHIVVYIEEAHNLIGRKQELTDTWPRLAKEGAKYRVALVYATQEPSSVHPNILANTENWFVTHLNNEGELKEISKFYDFADFGRSLIRAQDVGFARVKTLSGPFVIPVQIDLFDPQAEIDRQKRIGKSSSRTDLSDMV